MTISIQKKLTTGFGLCVVLMTGLVISHVGALQKLEILYQDTYRRSLAMEQATDAQHIGGDLYLVIANAVINRDLVQTGHDWAAAKLANRAKLARVAAAADGADQRQKVAEAQAALDDIVRIFESEMLPAIRTGAGVPGPLADIDARLDVRVEAIVSSLQSIARSMSADNDRARRQFHTLLTESISLGLGISLFGVLTALAISTLTTRSIARPLAELTQAAHQIARGNYAGEVHYRSGDEAGVLAHAFRAMTAEVAKRTLDLEQANRQLNNEVRERRLSEAEVSRLNAELEERVAERTAELMQTNEQLEQVVETQRQTEVELKKSRAELRSLSQHLQEVLEAERTDMARQIHDDLGQMLTALKMDLAWIGKKLPEDQRQLLERTLTVSRHIDQSISTVQQICARLRPGILDDLGLEAALEWQAQEFEKKTGIGFTLDCDFDCSILPRHCATEIFRIFQETLSNIYRHSAASRASLTMARQGEALVVTVSDNGRGVSESAIDHHLSLGFIGMRERVRSLGGELAIARLAEGGTRVQVTIPLTGGPEEAT